MYVVFESFLAAIFLWLIEALLMGYLLRKKSWKLHLLTQIFLIILIWPTAQIAFQIIFNLDTKDVKAATISDLEFTARMPSECKDIVYHKDPTGRWFYCAIPKELAYRWLKEYKYSENSSSYCGPYEEYPREVQSIINSGGAEHYVTELKPNGAGSSVTMTKNGMFLCQWYW
ncbi:MAG: hypothetical protein P8166_00975 [Candidatus Thiodiazotropha sp.]